jgi:hypothetical protein
MAVEARFYVAEVVKRPSSRMGGYAAPVPIGEVVLRPAGGKGNEEWASATPTGEMRLTIRTEALGWFEERLGAHLAIRFDDVPSAE